MSIFDSRPIRAALLAVVLASGVGVGWLSVSGLRPTAAAQGASPSSAVAATSPNATELIGAESDQPYELTMGMGFEPLPGDSFDRFSDEERRAMAEGRLTGAVITVDGDRYRSVMTAAGEVISDAIIDVDDAWIAQTPVTRPQIAQMWPDVPASADWIQFDLAELRDSDPEAAALLETGFGTPESLLAPEVGDVVAEHTVSEVITTVDGVSKVRFEGQPVFMNFGRRALSGPVDLEPSGEIFDFRSPLTDR